MLYVQVISMLDIEYINKAFVFSLLKFKIQSVEFPEFSVFRHISIDYMYESLRKYTRYVQLVRISLERSNISSEGTSSKGLFKHFPNQMAITQGVGAIVGMMVRAINWEEELVLHFFITYFYLHEILFFFII